MPVQCVKPSERLAASFAGERTVIRVQLFVALAIVLTSKALIAPRPLASKRLLVVVAAHMTCIQSQCDVENTENEVHTLQVEVPSERASTSGNWACELRVVRPPAEARLSRCAGRHVDLLDRSASLRRHHRRIRVVLLLQILVLRRSVEIRLAIICQVRPTISFFSLNDCMGIIYRRGHRAAH